MRSHSSHKITFVKKHYKSNVGVTNFLLNLGIYARASVSFIESFFKRKKKISRTVSNKNKFLLIGDPFSASEAENSIKQNFSNASIRKLQSLQSLSMQQDEFDEIAADADSKTIDQKRICSQEMLRRLN